MALSNKRIPKSLEECYEEDVVSKDLWMWSQRLVEWGKEVLGTLIVIGSISTIIDAVEMADINEDLVIYTVISSITTWGLYSLIEFCTYNVLSLLVTALASIVQNSKITANVALYNAAKDVVEVEEVKVEKKEVKKPKPSVSDNIAAEPKPAEKQSDERMIKCPSCGQIQKKDRTWCYNCGQKFDTAPFSCGKCGFLGPYDGNCPSCGSSIKLFK